jgi:tetratricopeptide (TPR) repeat protein
VDLAEVLTEAGDIARADELLSAAENERSVSARAALARFHWLVTARPEHAIEAIESALPRLLEQLAQTGDDDALARAHLVAFDAKWLPGRVGSAAPHAVLAAEHARKAGNDALRSMALGAYLAAALLGPDPAESIARKVHEIERIGSGPHLTAGVTWARGKLEALAGRFDDARRLMSEAIDGYLALGERMNAASLYPGLADLDMLEGDAVAARHKLSRADTILAAAGERSYRATILAALARVEERLGDPDAARDALTLSEQLGAARDVANFVITHQVRARIALAEGDAEAAERWARSAVRYAQATEAVPWQADTHLELARVLAAVGRPAEALAEARTALALYERKGDRPRAGKAQALLEELGASSAVRGD